MFISSSSIKWYGVSIMNKINIYNLKRSASLILDPHRSWSWSRSRSWSCVKIFVNPSFGWSWLSRLARFRFPDLGWMVTESISWHNWGQRQDLLDFRLSQSILVSLTAFDGPFKFYFFTFWVWPTIHGSLPAHQAPLHNITHVIP